MLDWRHCLLLQCASGSHNGFASRYGAPIGVSLGVVFLHPPPPPHKGISFPAAADRSPPCSARPHPFAIPGPRPNPAGSWRSQMEMLMIPFRRSNRLAGASAAQIPCPSSGRRPFAIRRAHVARAHPRGPPPPAPRSNPGRPPA
ncbi:hypothetical protein GQ55_2G407500 [Panicum hallii var. hallii]|uniref:Uncharacterized protein n=1 Tax=Panicum hallii var. hallii TaxID=1504633 RepID=A0A2T7EXN3_9POAL|nr:hypothetical protein GQ55_2G407500 [Panicum hallii var. hallii]